MSDQENLTNGEDQEGLSLKDAIAAVADEQLAQMEGDGEVEDAPEIEAADEAEDQDEIEEEEAEGDAEEDDSGLEEEPVEAPEHYSAEDKEIFKELPRKQAEWLVERSKMLDNRHAERMRDLSNGQREHEGIVEAFKPVEPFLTQHGLDRVTAVRRLVGAQTHLMTNAPEALALLATQYGGGNREEVVRKVAAALNVDLGSARTDGGATDEYLDPALAERVSQLDQNLNQLQGTLQTQAQAAQQQVVSQAQQQIDQFRDAVDDGGKVLHPHFERVKNTMAVFISQGISPDMEDAYNRAVMSDPELAEQAFKQRQEKSAKERDAQRKKEVAKAKKASRNVKGEKTAETVQRNKPESTKDALRATLEEWDSQHAG